LVSFPLNF